MKHLIPEFKTKKELFTFLKENKETLLAQKMAIAKTEDCCAVYQNTFWDRKTKKIFKAEEPLDENITQLKAVCIINTTNFLDSHGDVHLPGIWDKSLNENNRILHLQEHQMAFANIIASGKDLQARVQTFTWKELGFDYEGTTQALVFDSDIKKTRNGFMFDQYRKGYVENHSVGMRYIWKKLVLCINDEEQGAEFEAWNKYLPEVANKDVAEEKGWFWIVNEAKVVEGSAVPIGSNIATPTYYIEENKDEGQPLKDTDQSQKPGETTSKNSINQILFH